MASTHEYVPVITAGDVIEAEFYKALLVGNDIPAIVADENSEAIGFPQSIVGQGGVPVLVPEDMKEQAEEILKQQKDGPVDQAELEREAVEASGEDLGEMPEDSGEDDQDETA